MCSKPVSFDCIVYNVAVQPKKNDPLSDSDILQIYGWVAPHLRGCMNG